jgi:TonB family protein
MEKVSIKIKLYFLLGLYEFVDLLTDVSKANSFIVKKKISIGAAIISMSLSLSSCSSHSNKTIGKSNKKTNVVEAKSTCYITISTDNKPIEKRNTIRKNVKQKSKEIRIDTSYVSVVSCYDISVVTAPEFALEDTLAFVEQMPSFKGGLDSMQKFITRNLKYPEDMAEICVTGRVIVQFTVTHNGDIESPRILRSLHSSLDEEAIRVVNLMPKWIPGKQNGKEVNVRFTLPITFNYN